MWLGRSQDLARGAIAGFERTLHPRGPVGRVLAREVHTTFRMCAGAQQIHLAWCEHRDSPSRRGFGIPGCPAARLWVFARAGIHRVEVLKSEPLPFGLAQRPRAPRAAAVMIEYEHGAGTRLVVRRVPDLAGPVRDAEAVQAVTLPIPAPDLQQQAGARLVRQLGDGPPLARGKCGSNAHPPQHGKRYSADQTVGRERVPVAAGGAERHPHFPVVLLEAGDVDAVPDSLTETTGERAGKLVVPATDLVSGAFVQPVGNLAQDPEQRDAVLVWCEVRQGQDANRRSETPRDRRNAVSVCV